MNVDELIKRLRCSTELMESGSDWLSINKDLGCALLQEAGVEIVFDKLQNPIALLQVDLQIDVPSNGGDLCAQVICDGWSWTIHIGGDWWTYSTSAVNLGPNVIVQDLEEPTFPYPQNAGRVQRLRIRAAAE